MATKVHMEALSPTMEEGQLVSWLKNEGDEVAEGDVLAEIETDKATMELVARGSGVLRKRLIEEGGTAPVGAVIGVIAPADADISAILEEVTDGGGAPSEDADVAEQGEDASGAADAGDGRHAGESEEPRRAADAEGTDESPGDTAATATPTVHSQGAGRDGETGGAAADAAREDGARVKASPLARRLAAEAGIDVGEVTGSGPGGRIIKADIEGAVSEGLRRAGRAAPPSLPPAFAPPADIPEVEEVPVSQMRKTIARRLVTSIGPVPTFYLTMEADMDRMLDLRSRLNGRLEAQGIRVSVNDLVIKATAASLRRHPEVNASWGEGVIRRYGRVHIGVAVAVEDGLITPVVRDADRKSVAQIGVEVKELAGRARARRLQPDEYQGATFSVSNLGMFGIDEFTAIINPPEAAILAVGRVEEKPVVVDGEVVIRSRMRLTMSCDHRVVDGATGARFLQTLREFLEEPALMAL